MVADRRSVVVVVVVKESPLSFWAATRSLSRSHALPPRRPQTRQTRESDRDADAGTRTQQERSGRRLGGRGGRPAWQSETLGPARIIGAASRYPYMSASASLYQSSPRPSAPHASNAVPSSHTFHPRHVSCLATCSSRRLGQRAQARTAQSRQRSGRQRVRRLLRLQV